MIERLKKFQAQERRLTDFVTFMEDRGATVITHKLALEWATLPPGRHCSWAQRLCDVRGFARHLVNVEPRTEVPPVRTLPPLRRAKPYLYTDEEIQRLLAAAHSDVSVKGGSEGTHDTMSSK